MSVVEDFILVSMIPHQLACQRRHFVEGGDFFGAMLGIASCFPYGFANVIPEERQQHFRSSLWMFDSKRLKDYCPLVCNETYWYVIQPSVAEWHTLKHPLIGLMVQFRIMSPSFMDRSRLRWIILGYELVCVFRVN